ncbi:MAG: hypothetical protein FWD66_08240 [Paludibacter sp.]|nr:hypothetical protein [Paludibacter sp.]
MKNTLVISLISAILLFSCGKSKNCNISNTDINNYEIQTIDTLHFIKYWELFSYSLLQKDTTTLKFLIKNNVKVICVINETNQIMKTHYPDSMQISKTETIKELLYSTNPVYFNLIQDYNIVKDLFGKKPYFCYIEKHGVRYGIKIQFDGNNESVELKLQNNIGNKFANLYNNSVCWIFTKSKNNICLSEIQCYVLAGVD